MTKLVHNMAVLLSLNAYDNWAVQDGKYKDGKYEVSYHPEAFGYSLVAGTEILHNNRITTEQKVTLIRHLAQHYEEVLNWAKQTRGRKIGIEADLTKGGIAYNQDSKITLLVEYWKKIDHWDMFHITRFTRDTNKDPRGYFIAISISGIVRLLSVYDNGYRWDIDKLIKYTEVK